MSRVEVSQNIGPHVITSMSSVRAPASSDIFKSETFNKHSYQVITTRIKPNTNISFVILGTNDEKANWIEIARYNIKGDSAPSGPRNKSGVMHFDFWNYKSFN